MSHFTLSIRPATGGVRKFAVTAKEAVVTAHYQSGEIAGQSDQTWEADVWQRIEGRGYVCRLDGNGQWSNRGDHGTYIGAGATAEDALRAAWGATMTDEDGRWDSYGPPRCLLAPMRDYDATVRPVEIE